MATASTSLSDEQLTCSICLDIFVEPVTIPCGHNYCKPCIYKYWDGDGVCQCPMCKRSFTTAPDLSVNVFVSELVDQFREAVKNKTTNSEEEEHIAQPEEVPCDICDGTKLKALKSCVVCGASYCGPHLKDHQTVAALKRHKLIDPVKNLDDWMCKKHERLLQFFNKTTETYLCQFCTESNHGLDDIVPLEDEFNERKKRLGETTAALQFMIGERNHKIGEIQHSVKIGKDNAQNEKMEGVKAFASLVASLKRAQAEFEKEVQERQKAVEKKAEDIVKEIQLEIGTINTKKTELEQLSHYTDQLDLLKSFPSLYASPVTKDWSEINLHPHVHVGTLRRALAQLPTIQMNVERELARSEIRKVQQFAVSLTLDPDTAHPQLILSRDGKQVRNGEIGKKPPHDPEKSDRYLSVFAKQGFLRGRFYFEVQIRGSEVECSVGVMNESVKRRGPVMCLDRGEAWVISPWCQKVGVYVDYEDCHVSFYDVQNEDHILSYTSQTFTEKLYPYLCIEQDGTQPKPATLIISPVP